jgi:S-adenosylmethionine synthetase
MGVREGRGIELTVAMPFIDSNVRSVEHYFELRDAVSKHLEERISAELERIDSVSLVLNALDRRDAGVAGTYLSVIGTSAEGADSGQVGRGNQPNGVIALYRPRGAEAAAGKNPVSHVGKIYSVFSHWLAGRLHANIRGLESVTVWLASRIGDPVVRPRTLAIETILASGCELGDVEAEIRDTVERELEGLPRFCDELSRGKHPVC